MSASLLRLLLITCACTREVPLYLSVCVRGPDCPLCCTGRDVLVPLASGPPPGPGYREVADHPGPRAPTVALRLVEEEEEEEEEEARVALRRDADAAGPRGRAADGPGSGRARPPPPPSSPASGRATARPEPRAARPGLSDGEAARGHGREVSKRYGGFMRRVGRPKGRWPKRSKKKRYGGFIRRFFGLAIRSPRLA